MKSGHASALIVGTDTANAEALEEILHGEEVQSSRAADEAEALSFLESRPVDLVLVELRLIGAAPHGFLTTMLQRFTGTPFVILATELEASRAIEALRAGAADVLMQPYDRDALRLVLERALVQRDPTADVSRLDAPGALLGDSPAMREACAVLDRAAHGNATVLIRGESGTGKELVARALHEKSARASGPFVKIDCAALPENLLESELFGYEKGAFTGATSRKLGRVELANAGTLFLDEIGELTPSLQAKLLRLLQDRRFERLGGTTTLDADVRIVAATHRDLENMIQRGAFRQDLFYRLNVIPIWLPPLRARRGDIASLARHFCSMVRAEYGKAELELDDGAIRVLRSERWPGNVRQLQNLVERLVVLANGSSITERDARSALEQNVRFATEEGSAGAPDQPRHGAHRPVERLSAELRATERRALLNALNSAGGNRSLAARMLGVSRSFLYRKLEEYELG